MVVRIAEGYFLAGFCKTFKILAEPSLAETIAAVVAVDFVMESPFRKIIFERDVLSVINLIYNMHYSLGPYGHIINNIRRVLFF